MGGPLKVVLSEQDYRELVFTRDHDATPSMREKAAGILKVTQGYPTTYVEACGLLKKQRHETISHWIYLYQQKGLQGLRVKAGRGRKPAFFPCA